MEVVRTLRIELRTLVLVPQSGDQWTYTIIDIKEEDWSVVYFVRHDCH